MAKIMMIVKLFLIAALMKNLQGLMKENWSLINSNHSNLSLYNLLTRQMRFKSRKAMNQKKILLYLLNLLSKSLCKKNLRSLNASKRFKKKTHLWKRNNKVKSNSQIWDIQKTLKGKKREKIKLYAGKVNWLVSGTLKGLTHQSGISLLLTKNGLISGVSML